MHSGAVWMNKTNTAWRTENADKTSKSARSLDRAVRPSYLNKERPIKKRKMIPKNKHGVKPDRDNRTAWSGVDE